MIRSHTSRNEYTVGVGGRALCKDTLDDIGDGRAYSARVGAGHIGKLV